MLVPWWPQVSPIVRIMVTRSVALVPTLAVALMMQPGSTQLDRLNQGLNLLQSVQLPFALLPVLTFAGSARVMGRLANGCVLTGGALLAPCCQKGPGLLVSRALWQVSLPAAPC